MSAENDALSANEGDAVDNVREQVLKGKLDQVQQEKAFLLDSLNRTEAQLRRVLKQQEACSPAAALSEQQEQELRAQNEAPRPPWLASHAEMSPLLAAYDGRVGHVLERPVRAAVLVQPPRDLVAPPEHHRPDGERDLAQGAGDLVHRDLGQVQLGQNHRTIRQ